MACAAFTFAQAADAPKYENNFESAEIDSVPEEFLVLDGNFAVKEEGGNKFFELPGAPLDSFGVLFGPSAKKDVTASARILGTKKGRRFPTFAVGVNGVGGYKLRVSPGKKQIEIYRGDRVKASVPHNWQSGKWTHLELGLTESDGKWDVTGKVWTEGEEKPEKPTITFQDAEAPPGGRQMISGSPYAGTPIRFDDLKVTVADE